MKTIGNEKHSQALNGQTCQAKTHERKHVRHVQLRMKQKMLQRQHGADEDHMQ